MAQNLIIYYSRTGENYWNGSIRNIAKGNTEIVAEFIQSAVGGDLFKVDTVNPNGNRIRKQDEIHKGRSKDLVKMRIDK